MHMEDLLELADAMGLRVLRRDLGRRNGEVHSSGLIIINPHRNYGAQRETLAHEIGHAAHGHDWTADRHDRAVDERAADTYAARLLISPAEYALAERICGPHDRALARELNVSVRLVELWRDAYRAERLAEGRHLYAV